jgi:hypothetical protein
VSVTAATLPLPANDHANVINMAQQRQIGHCSVQMIT